MCEIVVEPHGVGWTVTVVGEAKPMVFLRGRAAELAARQLAATLSAAGRRVDLTIRLRDGTVAATIPFREAAIEPRPALAQAA